MIILRERGIDAKRRTQALVRRLPIAVTAILALAPQSQLDAQSPSEPDIIIVGSGIAGLSAALEAARGGVGVQVLDMWSVFGGHAVMSGGGLSIIGSDFQREHGVVDTPELARKDFFDWGGDPDPYWVDYYTANSRTQIGEWVEALGVQWSALSHIHGNSMPRFHRPEGRGLGLVAPIYREVLRYPNVAFRWSFQVTELLVQGGRVAGVRGADLRTDEIAEIRADHVLLATGGFQSNLEMVRRFWPADLAEPSHLLFSSGRNSVGFGHELAEAAGAGFHRMDHQWNYPWGLPHPRYPGEGRALAARNETSIWVNAQAVRFTHELQSAKYLFPAVVQQEPSTYWAIFDEDQKTTFYASGTGWDDPERYRTEILENPSLTTSASSIADLALQIGLNAEDLERTVRRFNDMVEAGVDEDFGRFDIDDVLPATAKINEPPFYAIQFFPMTRKSMGGVTIDGATRVLREDGSVIPGLYAAGELTGFAGLNGSAGLEGTFLGPSLLTGRVAGRTLLAEVAAERDLTAPSPLAIPLEAAVRGVANAGTAACAECHNLPGLVSASRQGYAHFERVHGIVLENGEDCGTCHAETIPYDPLAHEIDRFAQTYNCAHCHLADEQP